MDRPELTLTQSVDSAHAALQCRVQNARPETVVPAEPITITLNRVALKLLRAYCEADTVTQRAHDAWEASGPLGARDDGLREAWLRARDRMNLDADVFADCVRHVVRNCVDDAARCA